MTKRFIKIRHYKTLENALLRNSEKLFRCYGEKRYGSALYNSPPFNSTSMKLPCTIKYNPYLKVWDIYQYGRIYQ